MQTGTHDRSLGELFGDLSRETSTLVRQEVTLAKTELTGVYAQTPEISVKPSRRVNFPEKKR